MAGYKPVVCLALTPKTRVIQLSIWFDIIYCIYTIYLTELWPPVVPWLAPAPKTSVIQLFTNMILISYIVYMTYECSCYAFYMIFASLSYNYGLASSHP